MARVEIGAQNEDAESRLNGKPAVAMGLYLAPGANAVQTAQRVAQTLAHRVGSAFRKASRPRSSTISTNLR